MDVKERAHLRLPHLLVVKPRNYPNCGTIWKMEQKERIFEKLQDILKGQAENAFDYPNKSQPCSAEGRWQTCQKSILKVVWKLFKFAIFLFCTTCFYYQADEFYNHFYAYPTTLNVHVTSKDIKLPAITICSDNPMSRQDFCRIWPEKCQTPDYLQWFCEKHREFCLAADKIVIPKFGYFASNEDAERVMKYSILRYHPHVSKFIVDMSFKGAHSEGYETGYVFDKRTGDPAKCHYSHLVAFDERDIAVIPKESEKRTDDKHFAQLQVSIRDDMAFYPWQVPREYVSVHSPLEPVNPLETGIQLKAGSITKLFVRLTEKHLLPHPYKTECVDYENKWRKNKKRGPRSQQMCKYICHSSYYIKCAGCEFELIMYPNILNKCWYRHNMTAIKECYDKKESDEDFAKCMKNCKPDCISLNYEFEKSESDIFVSDIVAQEAVRDDKIVTNWNRRQWRYCFLHLATKDVTVLSYVPLYKSEDLFSYIGGLLGCWLGISVWAFVDIFETTYFLFYCYIKKLLKKSKDPEEIKIY